MGERSPRRVKRLREGLVPASLAGPGLVFLAAFILYGSSGPFTNHGTRVAELPGLSLPDIAQNVLLYVPFGILGCWFFRDYRWTRSVFWLTLLTLALVYSSAMELLQVALASRVGSLLDVFSNVAGAALGGGIATPVERMLSRVVRRLHLLGVTTAPARFLLVAVLAAIVLVAWYPFDITLDISTLSERTRPFRNEPWLRPSATALWAHAASFALLATATAFCVPRLARWAAAVALGFTILVALVVDLGQLAMGSQPIGLAALACQFVGACVGAAVALVAMLLRGTEYAAA